MKLIIDYVFVLEYGVYDFIVYIVYDVFYNYFGIDILVYNWDYGYFGNIIV